MKRVSTAYKQAMAKKIRDHSYMVVSVGVISNEAQSSAKVDSQTFYLSDDKLLFSGDDVLNEYATLEENQWKADGTQIYSPEDAEIIQLANDRACISQNIMGSITVSFDNAYDLKGLTLNFGDCYPTEFNVIINGSTTFNYTNDQEEFVSEDNYWAVETITITPIHFINGDDKRLRIQRMLMGVGIVFSNKEIESASYTDTTSFVSEELPQLDFTMTAFDKNKRFNVDDSNSFINYLEAGQAINCIMGIELEDSSVEWVNMPITYITEWASDGIKVSFTSADRIALFTEKYEEGFYIHTRTLYDDARAIFQYLGLEPDEYVIDDVLRDVVVTNPMPTVSCAECLQLIANAGRCALRQDVEGRILLIPNFENIVEPTDILVSTNSQAAWSKPENIRTGSTIIYADLTQDFWSADGSMYYMPENGEPYLETGFVSRDIADENGDFTTNPTFTLTLPASYTYFGMNFVFGGNPPQEMNIRTYKSGSLVTDILITDMTNEYHVDESFYTFDEMQIEFTKASPYDRIVVQQVSFGDLTDYRLMKQDMMANPIGVVEPKTQSVSVRVFTFENDAHDKPKQVDDEVYYTKTLGTVGAAITFENPLISTMSHAENVAKWLANYYANNVSYSVDYRGEPRLEALDYIFMDSDILNNLQVEVESHTLNFNGALSGTLELRRAANMINSNT